MYFCVLISKKMKKTSLFTILTALPVMFLPMQMLAAWEFSANGNVLSAYGESGYTVESPLSITIAAPTDLQFDGNYKPATLSNTAAWTAAGLTVPTILYNGKEHAPSMLGTYTASISAGGATAEVVYTIKTVINYLSFFDGGLTQGKNYDVISGTGAYEVALNNSEHKGVYWNSEESCAVFDGEAYLQIDNPLGNVTPNSGLTITMDVWISSDNNGSGTFIRSTGVEAGKNGWQRLFDMSDGTTADCIFINAGDARNGRAHLMFCLRRGYETGQTEVENTSGNSFFNQWCTVTMVVAPGGYSTLYVNGALLTHSSSSDVSKIVSVLEHISEFNKCYIGTSIFEATGDNADGFFIGKIRGFQTAEGALMPYYDGVDYHYLLSYATNGGDPIIGTFEATIPASLPTPTHPNPAAVFQGWFMDEDLTIPVTTGITLTKNTALYAKWTITNYILTDIPEGWTVTANGQTVPVTPNYTDSPMGSAIIPGGASVVLTPPDSVKPRVKDIDLLTPEQIPLTFEAKTAGSTVRLIKGSNLTSLNNLEYSTNDGPWTEYTYGNTIPLTNKGDKVSFRGNNATYATGVASDNYCHFSCSGNCYVYGNIMSLINKDTNDYATNKTLEGTYAFCNLFSSSNIYSHASKELILPATTLSANCYDHMFSHCSNLTNAPVLPATTLTDHCYFGMFMYCNGITTAPELPATTLASSCYYQMFAYTHISTTPELPATTLSFSCYHNMFQGCTYLTTATALQATTLASSCYSSMFTGCTNLTTAPALPATTLAYGCYSSMFNGCTKLTTAPELPATTLLNNCYYQMFKGCTKLNSVTCLATNISATNCTTEWLDNVAATGTFTKTASMTSWTTGASGIPSGWITIPVIPGAFSVSSTKKVYFAPGNLQYQASTNTWQFAEHQYTNIGASNSNISSSYSGWIDLFGWGTSGYNHGAVCYQPWSSSMTNTDYYPYGSATANLYDGDGKADWGYNAISNGGNTENCGWRTLKKDEWLYLFNSRATPSGIRYAKARVNGVDGIILLPDDWSTTYYSLTNTNVGNAAWTSNTITAYDWTNQLEAHGAVFFPVSGNRDGAHSPSSGFVSCWSSDYQAGNSNNAHVVYIPGDSVNPDAPGQRSTGNPVRLVRDVK